jgi:hypothetical protein
MPLLFFAKVMLLKLKVFGCEQAPGKEAKPLERFFSHEIHSSSA